MNKPFNMGGFRCRQHIDRSIYVYIMYKIILAWHDRYDACQVKDIVDTYKSWSKTAIIEYISFHYLDI